MKLLSENGNVYKTCISLLDIKGWKITIIPGPYEKEDSRLDSFEAIKDNIKIFADNPISLLGLATIHEFHHPHGEESYWWKIEGKDSKLYDRLQDESLEKGFLDYLERKPEECKTLIRKEINKFESDPSVEIHERLGISRETMLKLLKELQDLK